jgi:hypothetical protein
LSAEKRKCRAVSSRQPAVETAELAALKRLHLLTLISVWDVTNVIRFPFGPEKTTHPERCN